MPDPVFHCELASRYCSWSPLKASAVVAADGIFQKRTAIATT